MPDIVIPEFMNETVVAELAADYDVLYDPEMLAVPLHLEQALRTAPALIVRNRTQVRGALLEAAVHLKVIGRLGVGLDNIDLATCERRGIAVVRADLANAESVAEYVISGILMLMRGGAYFTTNDVIAGDWPRTRVIGREVKGKTLGLVGFGAIGRAVATQAISLGMRVIASDPPIERDDEIWAQTGVSPYDLSDLLGQSDVVSIHTPLTDETRNLIDGAALRALKPGAMLINAARGGIVDERALVESLRSGVLGGAMLDVFETEPLPASSCFKDVPNLILTPHIAGVTEESNARVSAMVATGVRQVLERNQ
ncbi:MAG: hydroxyacid dehydrogenase [Gammaproteobacteria bacterium]|nr:hydroxyacid dehydrogenase [Gammaproteobacteria bacterium]